MPLFIQLHSKSRVLFSIIFSSPLFWVYLTRVISATLHRTVCRIMSMATAASASASAWWMHWLFSRQLLADFPRRSARAVDYIIYILCMHSGARLLNSSYVCVCVCVGRGSKCALRQRGQIFGVGICAVTCLNCECEWVGEWMNGIRCQIMNRYSFRDLKEHIYKSVI